ncbi:MAG: hypothetical protein WCD42_12765 [Rhizomicrobium sp.]
MLAIRASVLAGACALLAVPAAASENTVSGYGEIFGGMGYQTEANHYKDSFGPGTHDQGDTSTFGGSGHINMNLSPDIGVQFDVSGQNIGYGSTNTSSDGFGAHLYSRKANSLFGVFGSVGNVKDSRFVTAGLDGKWFLDGLGAPNTSLDAQVSYSSVIQGDLQYTRADSWNAYLGANYFFTDNLAFSGGVGAALEQNDYAADGSYRNNVNLVNWNAKVEYKLHNMPLSVFASYQGNYISNFNKLNDSSSDYDQKMISPNNMLMVGLRIYFGENSLRDNDRNGASLADHNPWYGTQPTLAYTSL